VIAISAVAVAGCGASTTSQSSHSTTTRARRPAHSSATLPKARPQAVEPVVGAEPITPTVGQAPAAPGFAKPPRDPVPKQAASDITAPAAGAPTDAQVRAAVAKFQLEVATYHLDRLDFASVLLNPAELPPGQYNVSIASVYTDYGQPVACGGVLHVPELGVANKQLPCGTEVLFRYGNRAIRVPVIDRGPYIAGREWDLTGATAEALRFPGLGPIQWRLG
jgi:rare lipoprotein A (peptidoglycan hydrolase)